MDFQSIALPSELRHLVAFLSGAKIHLILPERERLFILFLKKLSKQMKYFDFDIKNGVFLHFLTFIKAKISCNGLHYMRWSAKFGQQLKKT